MSLSTTSELKSSDCDRWPALSRDQIEELLPGVKAWSVEGSEPPKLERKFKTKNFQCALDFVNHAGKVCEERGHHADLAIFGYNNVKLSIYSHGTNSLTENDFNLAKAIDCDFTIAYNKKWLKDHPEIHSASK
jgi:4a-hydroxytetrahydrobiopterin dehydratase|tara:strand:+ start:601 stop:999 length:399 start_codon:yes stop_codon:yes gene_type:complete